MLGIWCRCKDLVTVEAGDDDILAKDVLEWVRLSHRGDIVELQRIDVCEVLEHVGQLSGGALDLSGSEVESSQPGHLGDHLC